MYRKCQNIRSTFRCHFKSGADSQVDTFEKQYGVMLSLRISLAVNED
jgi:hypothetical protein